MGAMAYAGAASAMARKRVDKVQVDGLVRTSCLLGAHLVYMQEQLHFVSRFALLHTLSPPLRAPICSPHHQLAPSAGSDENPEAREGDADARSIWSASW